jgi:hypothetical protein
MKTSETINEISAALAKAQGKINNPDKNKENPAFKAGGKVSTYADLTSGINAIKGPLSECGIAIVQATRLVGDVLVVDTNLSHASGQWMESEYPVCRFPAKPQEAMSALTYARRAALFSMVGIAGEDDDGNAANHSETPAAKKQPAEDASAKWSREKASALIKTLQMADNLTDLSAWRENNRQAVNGLFAEDKKSVSAAYDAHAHKLTEKVES